MNKVFGRTKAKSISRLEIEENYFDKNKFRFGGRKWALFLALKNVCSLALFCFLICSVGVTVSKEKTKDDSERRDRAKVYKTKLPSWVNSIVVALINTTRRKF